MIITLRPAFQKLNELANSTLFSIEGELLKPRSNGIRLVILDALRLPMADRVQYRDVLDASKPSRPDFPYVMRLSKKEFEQHVKSEFEYFSYMNFVVPYYGLNTKKDITELANSYPESHKPLVCVQGHKGEPWGRRYVPCGEQLGELISMLYFRAKGYIVQHPIRSYGTPHGVDDIAAWKSPVISELRKHGFIDKGCHITELACLRWLGRPSELTPNTNAANECELVLVEVETSLEKGLSTSGQVGISQLIRAAQEKIAKQLYICFPLTNEDAEEMFLKIKERAGKGFPVGAILFGANGFCPKDSGTFPDDNAKKEIEAYEKNLKRALLNNFYFEEVLQMIKESGIDTQNRGIDEVLHEFCSSIEEQPIECILERVDEVVPKSKTI